MNRVLLKRGLTRKETLVAVEQAEPRIQELRRKFIELAKSLDPRGLVFIDEAGSASRCRASTPAHLVASARTAPSRGTRAPSPR